MIVFGNEHARRDKNGDEYHRTILYVHGSGFDFAMIFYFNETKNEFATRVRCGSATAIQDQMAFEAMREFKAWLLQCDDETLACVDQ